MTSILTVSPSPHVRSSMTTQKIMLLVVLALVPAIVAATVVFGPRALLLVVFCAVVSMFTELVCQKMMQKEVTVSDGSAMLTGVLLALNLPATLPLWEAAIGCIFAIAVVKQLFGGLGCAVLTFVIREFASMPEGCSFSILLMNLLTPYIDKLTMTHPFGAKPAEKKEAK